jgi:alpha-L-fucosidase
MLLRIRLMILFLAGVSVVQAQVYEANWESLDKRPVPQWYRDAKFGIFIHWGVYSVPAFRKKGEYAEWYQNGLNTGDSVTIAFHKKKYGDLSYYQFADQFKAELFNPDEWASLIERSGARYVVLTSKHHDGFALWPSKEATRDWGFPWNAMEAGPHRDLVGDLFTALRKTTVHPGLYYSLYEWYNPIWLKDRKRYVDFHMWPQMKDVIETYKPDVFWTDGEWEAPAETWKSTAFLAWLYNESPVKDKVVTYDRWGSGIRFKHGGVYTPEYQPDISFEDHYWEESRGMGYSYGYNRNEDVWDYNSAEGMVMQLVDKVSGGGNFLLDIGPDADGKIPPIMEERLLQIGDWMKVNSAAIYNSVRWRVTGQWEGGVKTCYFTYNPVKNDLYMILPHWPGGSFSVKDLVLAPGTKVELLETGETLDWAQTGGDLSVAFPAKTKDAFAFVVRFGHTGNFAANPKVVTGYAGSSLKPLVSVLLKDSCEARYTLDGSVPGVGSTLYVKPFVAEHSAIMAVRSFKAGALPGNTVVVPLTVYTIEPSARDVRLRRGLKLAAYELVPSSVADLSSSVPVRDTISFAPSIGDLTRADNAGLRYAGYFIAPKDGLYTFYLSVDDGGVMRMDGKVVVDHDGKHANTEKSGKIALKKGAHVFGLDYIQVGSDKALKLEYSVNGSGQQPVPASAWAH